MSQKSPASSNSSSHQKPSTTPTVITHATHTKGLTSFSVIQAENRGLYLKTIEKMFQIVSGILNEMCVHEETKVIPNKKMGS